MTYEINITREQSYFTPYQNSPLLPMLLLSLATQKHTPDTTTDIKDEYDYIVVGSGSAGAVVASRLSEIPCVNVLLLEAGEPPPLLTEVPALTRYFYGTDIAINYRTEPQKHTASGFINRTMGFFVGRSLGGSSVHNGMFAFRGHRNDYDSWEQSGAAGWSWKDVLPYFKKLEDNTAPDIVRDGFHGVGGPVTISRPRYNSKVRETLREAIEDLGYPYRDMNDGIEYGFADMQANIREGQRCSTAKAYLVPSENRTNLDIVPRAFVTKVLTEKKTAVGVRFDFNGSSREVRARKEVIISAGTVGTTQLLLLSGIGPRKTLQRFQIPEVANLPVGLNFHDHLAFSVNFVVNAPIRSYPEKLADPRNVRLYIKERVGTLAATHGTVQIGFFTNNRWDHPTSPPDHELFFDESFGYPGAGRLKPEIYEQFYEPYVNSTLVVCVVSNLHPKSRGYVSIRSTNPYDPPIIDPNYLEHPDDVRDLVAGMKGCYRTLETPAMKKLGIQPYTSKTVFPGCEQFVHDEDDYFECMTRSVVFSVWHSVGTAKMGHRRDPTTVVDPELRVKGIKGLRVADASIMPTVTTANTNIPCIMIGEKASDIIKRSLKCDNNNWMH